MVCPNRREFPPYVTDVVVLTNQSQPQSATPRMGIFCRVPQRYSLVSMSRGLGGCSLRWSTSGAASHWPVTNGTHSKTGGRLSPEPGFVRCHDSGHIQLVRLAPFPNRATTHEWGVLYVRVQSIPPAMAAGHLLPVRPPQSPTINCPMNLLKIQKAKTRGTTKQDHLMGELYLIASFLQRVVDYLDFDNRTAFALVNGYALFHLTGREDFNDALCVVTEQYAMSRLCRVVRADISLEEQYVVTGLNHWHVIVESDMSRIECIAWEQTEWWQIENSEFYARWTIPEHYQSWGPNPHACAACFELRCQCFDAECPHWPAPEFDQLPPSGALPSSSGTPAAVVPWDELLPRWFSGYNLTLTPHYSREPHMDQAEAQIVAGAKLWDVNDEAGVCVAHLMDPPGDGYCASHVLAFAARMRGDDTAQAAAQELAQLGPLPRPDQALKATNKAQLQFANGCVEQGRSVVWSKSVACVEGRPKALDLLLYLPNSTDYAAYGPGVTCHAVYLWPRVDIKVHARAWLGNRLSQKNSVAVVRKERPRAERRVEASSRVATAKGKERQEYPSDASRVGNGPASPSHRRTNPPPDLFQNEWEQRCAEYCDETDADESGAGYVDQDDACGPFEQQDPYGVQESMARRAALELGLGDHLRDMPRPPAPRVVEPHRPVPVTVLNRLDDMRVHVRGISSLLSAHCDALCPDSAGLRLLAASSGLAPAPPARAPQHPPVTCEANPPLKPAVPVVQSPVPLPPAPAATLHAPPQRLLPAARPPGPHQAARLPIARAIRPQLGPRPAPVQRRTMPSPAVLKDYKALGVNQHLRPTHYSPQLIQDALDAGHGDALLGHVPHADMLSIRHFQDDFDRQQEAWPTDRNTATRVLVATMLPHLAPCPDCQALTAAGSKEELAANGPRYCFHGYHVRVPCDLPAMPYLAQAARDGTLAQRLGCNSACDCPIRGGLERCACERRLVRTTHRDYCGLDLAPSDLYWFHEKALAIKQCCHAPRLDCDNSHHTLQFEPLIMSGLVRRQDDSQTKGRWYYQHSRLSLYGEMEPLLGGAAEYVSPEFLGHTSTRLTHPVAHNDRHLTCAYFDDGLGWARVEIGFAAEAHRTSPGMVVLDHRQLSSLERLQRRHDRRTYRTVSVCGLQINWQVDEHSYRVLPRVLYDKVYAITLPGMGDPLRHRQHMANLMSVATQEARALHKDGELPGWGGTLPQLATDTVRAAWLAALDSMSVLMESTDLRDPAIETQVSAVYHGKVRQPNWLQRTFPSLFAATNTTHRQPVANVDHAAAALGFLLPFVAPRFGVHLRLAAAHPPGPPPPGPPAPPPDRIAQWRAARAAGLPPPPGGKIREAPFTTHNDEQNLVHDNAETYLCRPHVDVPRPERKAKGEGKPARVCAAIGCMRVAPHKHTWPKSICPTCRSYDGNLLPSHSFGDWYQAQLDNGFTPSVSWGYHALNQHTYATLLTANPKAKEVRPGSKIKWDNPPVQNRTHPVAIRSAIATTMLAEAGAFIRKAGKPLSTPPGRLTSRPARLAGVAFSLSPSTFVKDETNLYIAAANRLLAKPAGYAGTGQSEPGFWEQVWDLLYQRADIADALWPGFSDGHYERMKLADWLEAFPVSRRKEFAQARQRPDFGMTSIERLARMDVFVKQELANNATSQFGIERQFERLGTQKPANPRTIANPSPEAHMTLGPHMRPLTHWFKKACRHDACVYYASDTPENLNYWVNQFYQPGDISTESSPEEDRYQAVELVHSGKAYNKKVKQYDREELPHRPLPKWFGLFRCVCTDFTMMDCSFDGPAFTFARRVYEHLGFPRHGRVSALWKAWAKPTLVTRLPNGKKIRMKPGHINASGRDDTALVNFVINSTLTFLGWLSAHLCAQGGTGDIADMRAMPESELRDFVRQVRIAIVGDDQCSVLPAALVKHAQHAADFAARGGFTAKVAIFDDILEVVFLGRRPVPTSVWRAGGWVPELRWASQAGRMLYKSGWQRIPTAANASWMKGKAFMEFLINSHMPISRAVFKATLSCLEGVNMVQPADFRIKPVPEIRVATRPNDDTWRFLMLVYGLDRRTVQECEHALLTQVQTLPGVFSHPAIDRIMAVDLADC